MTDDTGNSGGSGRGLAIALLLALVAAGVGYTLWDRSGGSLPLEEAVVSEAPQPAPEPEDPEPTEAAAADAEAPAPADAPEVAEAETPVVEEAAEAPSFDVVRVAPDGNTIIAGQAEPNSTVTVEVDGEDAGTAETDAQGGFVALLDIAPSDAPRALTLRATDGDGEAATSDQVVVLAPPAPVAPPAEDVAVAPGTADATDTAQADAATEPATGDAAVASAPDDDAGADTPAPQEVASDADTSPPAEEEAPAVLLADDEGVRVLQSPGAGPAVTDTVVIDAITYDSSGEVQLSGRGAGDGFVRLYIDNNPIEVSEVGEDGSWRADLPDVDTGVYTLRVDELDAAGQVVSRVETPFQREAPAAIQSLVLASGQSQRVVELDGPAGQHALGQLHRGVRRRHAIRQSVRSQSRSHSRPRSDLSRPGLHRPGLIARCHIIGHDFSRPAAMLW